MSKNRAKGGRNLAQPANEVQSATNEVENTVNEVQINEDQSVDQGLAAEAGEAQSTEHVAQGATNDDQRTVDVMREALQQAKDLGVEGADPANAEALIALAREQGATLEMPGDEPEAEGEQPDAVPKVQTTMGIGQFCRHLMLNSSKTNAEILALVLKYFPMARTTPACIAWYKTDLRKKGLLPATSGVRSAVKTVNLSAEELLQLTK
jgi:hypothetical protein